ncbi:MAG: FHA domain-containing protein [Phycisphaerales bacterium]|nr:FHA domain-containing protein [Phycisphaerales bacterium]
MLLLSVIQGPDKGKKFQLPDHEPQLIGRSSEALPITDTTVSRRHAELTPDDGEWWINDLTSQNGTWVNGVRIAERVRLRLGDQVRTGSTLFVFGRTDTDEHAGVIRVARPDQMEMSIEQRMPSNEDSVILAEPEPRSAAVHHLRVIYRLTTLTSQQTDRQKLLEEVMELVFTEFKPERGFIVLAEGVPQRKNQPVRAAVVKYAQRPVGKDDAEIHVSRTILQHASQGEGVLSSNAMHDPRFAAGDSVQRLAIRSAICSPIRFRERTFGTIYVDSSIANYTFTPEQLALMNAIGQHTGLALGNLDLYAQKLQAERLGAIGETVASLAHSIKNILQGLRGGADVVEMGLRKEDLKIARGGWGILKRNLDRIMALSLNMLAYSRQRRPEVELTKVAPLLEDCAALLQDQCTAKGVALLVDAEGDMPPVALDPHLMHQALMNLLGNAVEAVEPRKGAVTVRAAYHPGSSRGAAGGRSRPEMSITVIDNGPGIPQDQQDHIFEPFFSTKGLRGTGLGLAVTKRIVEEHGGKITVESAEGRGTTFTILVPADLAIDPSATAASRGG